MSDAERSGAIVKGIKEHARNGADKFTGTEHVGRVFIDAREQRWITEKLAEQGMKEAIKAYPNKLKEIRVVSKDFDISLKPGQKAVTRR